MGKNVSVVLFASGTGSNALNLIAQIKQHFAERIHLCGLICDREGAPVLEKVQGLGIPVRCLPRTKGMSRREHEQCILDLLQDWKPQWCLLAGYMRLLTPHFLSFFRNPGPRGPSYYPYYRVINIHPSLLPKYPGVKAFEQCFEKKDSHGGITVHLVDEGMDSGPILLQQSFARLEQDTLEDFKARGQALEHELYPKVLPYILDHKLEELLYEHQSSSH